MFVIIKITYVALIIVHISSSNSLIHTRKIGQKCQKSHTYGLFICKFILRGPEITRPQMQNVSTATASNEGNLYRASYDLQKILHSSVRIKFLARNFMKKIWSILSVTCIRSKLVVPFFSL
jgi:hypothetical protein